MISKHKKMNTEVDLTFEKLPKIEILVKIGGL